jgi:hypothetical protein
MVALSALGGGPSSQLSGPALLLYRMVAVVPPYSGCGATLQ